MEDELNEKTELKNLKDILIENLRIINENKTSKEIVQEDYKELNVPSLFSDDDANIEFLDLKNPELGNKILRWPRILLHKEIRDWVVHPLQEKQTIFNRKIAQSISDVDSQIKINKKRIESNQEKLQEIESELVKKIESNQEKLEVINDRIESNQEKLQEIESELVKKIEFVISKNLISGEDVKIKNIVKRNFLDILKRYPDKGGLEYFSNEIKNGKMTLSDLESKLRKTIEFKNLKLIEHACIYTKYGTKMYLDKVDLVISKELAVNQVWEPNETEFLKSITKKGMNVLDLGAHIGYYTILFSKWVGEKGKVFCFEPESNNYELLLKNIKANKSKNVVPFQKAVSNQKESRSLFLSEENKGDHSLINIQNGKNGEKIDVECVRLDSTSVAENKIDIIKMDLQGAEMLALDGMGGIIENNPKLVVLTEFWPFGIEKSGFSPKDFLKKISQIGFKIFLIKDNQLSPISINYELAENYSKNDFVNLVCKKQ